MAGIALVAIGGACALGFRGVTDVAVGMYPFLLGPWAAGVWLSLHGLRVAGWSRRLAVVGLALSGLAALLGVGWWR